jgi:TonB-linked SusC/RagA family outer membrane protein
MRKLFLLLLGVVFIATQAMAQRTITGRVTDEKGNPMANVSVIVRGTTTGTTTKADGTFSLVVPANGKALVFSAVDMSPVEKAIGTGSVVEATLKAEDKTLSEVVVVGYGTQRRKEVTGNLSTVKGAAVANKPIQSFEQALAGRATGVQITVPNGVLNTPPVFRIRGTNSLSLSSYPLIIVDGVPTPTGDFSATSAAGNALASINPNDIESIDIAKDAGAAAIYGSRAANGVVFITTKKGRPGKPRVSYNGSAGWTNVYGVPKILNAQQYTDYKNMAASNNGSLNTTNPAGAGYTKFALTNDLNGNIIDTYWPDYVYRTGFSVDHTLSISGGNDNTTYYFSAGYTDQSGIVRKNSFNRRNILMNVDSRVSKLFSVGGKISYSNELNKAASTSGSLSGEAFNTAGLGRIVLVNAPNVSPYALNGSYNINANNVVGPMSNSIAQVGFYNPVPLLDLNRSNSESNHIQTNVYVQFKPVNWLTLKTLYGLDYLFVDNEIFQSPIHGDGFTPGGNASSTEGKFKRWIWDNTIQIDKSFRKHNFSLLAGSEQDRSTTVGFGVNRQSISDPSYNIIQAGWTINNATGLAYGERYLLSLFSRLNYDYNKRYFLSANIRQDEYSAFLKRKSVFYGISGGWEMSRENWWHSRIFNMLRLRGSYGKVGNNSGIGDYPGYSTYGSGLYGGNATLIFNQAGNPKLRWETSKKTDVGFNLGMWKDMITIDFSYYKNDISDLILNVPQSPSTGVPNTIPTNVGTMYNKGFELSVSANPIRSKNFNWTSTLNYSNNKNEVTSLAPGLTEVLTATSGLETVSRTAVGYSAGYIWVVRTGGVDPATGRRILINKNGQKVLYQFYAPSGQFNWSNPDGTQYKVNGVAATVTQAVDGVMYGNSLPKYIGGWDNSFKMKDFDLDVLLTYQGGFSIYYGSHAGLFDQRFWNNSIDVLRGWRKPGDATDIPKPVYGDNVSNGSALSMDWNVFKGDFVKLKNVTLGYSIPASVLNRVKIASVRLYISGQNLAIFTKYPGPDPEVSSNGNEQKAQGVDRNTIANGRTIVFGINVGF